VAREKAGKEKGKEERGEVKETGIEGSGRDE
jgi:hypothetical protein